LLLLVIFWWINVLVLLLAPSVGVVITAQWSVHDVVDAVLLLQQDVLENDQIKLDSMFKFSLIQDIVRVTVALCCAFCSACRCDGLQNRGCRIQGLKLWSVSQSA